MPNPNTEQSTVQQPHVWLGWVVGSVFTLMGIGLLLIFGRQALDVLQGAASMDDLSDAQTQALIVSGIAIGLASLGLLALIGMAFTQTGRTPFRHAAADVLPDVPSLPLDTYTDSFMKPAGSQRVLHRWVDEGGVVQLAPDRRARRRTRISIGVTFGLVLMGWAVLIFATPAFEGFDIADMAVPRPVIFAVVFVFTAIPAGGLLAIYLYMQRRENFTVSFDTRSGGWRIDRPDGSAAGQIDNLIAIQLCIHHQPSLSESNATPVADTFQLILVETDHCGSYHRHLLLEAQAPAHRIAHLGSRLAERLNLPLLHHATAAHRAAAKIEGMRRRDALRD